MNIKEDGLKRIRWGEVMECIKAQTNGKKGKFISAAVMTTDVFDSNKKYLGGFALEYSGSGSREDALKSLGQSLKGLIERRKYGKIEGEIEFFKDNVTSNGMIIHPGKIFVYDSMKVKEEHGTVLASLCWVSYKYPSVKPSRHTSKKTRKRRKL